MPGENPSRDSKVKFYPLARYFGAEVTAVDRENKLDLLRSIGANQVIDYARDDLTKYCVSYDVIIDMVGKTTFSSIVGVLAESGRILLPTKRCHGCCEDDRARQPATRKCYAACHTQRQRTSVFLRNRIEEGSVKR